MELTATIGNERYAVKLDSVYDISIPVRFDEPQLSAFGAPPATRKAYTTEGFTGNVGKGGSCNCDTLHFTPHTSGTHTECIGHITAEPYAVCDLLDDSLIPATLITIAPQPAESTKDHYTPHLRLHDPVLTRQALELALDGTDNAFHDALIIRTLPNNDSKQTMNYGVHLPAFFSTDAIEYLLTLDITHLLVDIPSIDRMDDGGHLSNHHHFWGIKRGQAKASPKTITELIYADSGIRDGNYLLNLQVAPLAVDAAPSRPLLYEIERL